MIKKYYIPKELLKAIMERPTRTTFQENHGFELTDSNGDQLQLFALEDLPKEEKISKAGFEQY